MRFIVQETLTRSYEVEAEDFDEAISKAETIDESQADTDSEGFTYVYCADTGKELIL